MQNTTIESQLQAIEEAEVAINQCNQFWDALRQQWQIKKEAVETDEIEQLRSFQLLLQYRLDSQSILKQLAGIQHSLLQLLGIEHQHSIEMVLERITFALGGDDLQHALSLLNQLLDVLIHLLTTILQKQLTVNKEQAIKQAASRHRIDKIAQVVAIQKKELTKITTLHLALENIGGSPHPGVIYDHIAAIVGPISRFFQALQHGLIVTADLYQQMQNKINWPHYQHALTALPNSPTLNPCLMKRSDDKTLEERLEQRALTRRLGHFFYH